MGTEFTYSNESGEPYQYKVTIELSSELIMVHLESRGGKDPSGQIYGADFPEAVPRLFLELWNRNLTIERIYWNPTKGLNKKKTIEERTLVLDWPRAFKKLGKEGIRKNLGKQMKDLGGHYQSPMMVEISRPPDVKDVFSAAVLIGCNLNQEIETFDLPPDPTIEDIERNLPRPKDNLGEVFEKEPLGPEGYVYLLTNPSFRGWVKVGKSADTVVRESSYNTGDPYRSYRMRSRKLFPNRHLAERMAHSEMEGVRGVERRGEWFRIELSEAEHVLKNLTISKI